MLKVTSYYCYANFKQTVRDSLVLGDGLLALKNWARISCINDFFIPHPVSSDHSCRRLDPLTCGAIALA